MRRRGRRVIVEAARHQLILALIRSSGALQLRSSKKRKRMAWLSRGRSQDVANQGLSLLFLPGGVKVGYLRNAKCPGPQYPVAAPLPFPRHNKPDEGMNT